MIVYSISETTTILDTCNQDNINVFCQFFIHPNKERQFEFLQCLKFNVNNKHITNIYLLNERIYNTNELQVDSKKIIQVNIKKRLAFKDVFQYIDSNQIKGYNMIINLDIFFDETINKLFYTDIHLNKKMYALLRYDYNNKQYKLFSHRGDSQDTWIIHSNFSINKKECNIFNFNLGFPGCDNKMIYLMSLLGFNVLNDPDYIKTYHIHNTNIRNYTANDRINPPYEIIIPKSSLPYSIHDNSLFKLKYNHHHSNIKLFEYITKKLTNNEHFVIPRVSTIETCYAVYPIDSSSVKFFNSNIYTMKNNAGIKLSSIQSIAKYSTMYLEAFKSCELYGAWSPYDSVYRSIKSAHELLDEQFKDKDTFYPEAYDIYNYIYSTPWTFALSGKKILIVSNFYKSIEEKISIRKEIYGVDLFPECEILTICPPQTQGTNPSLEFDIELAKFTEKLDLLDYDIALVSCGGYGSLVCAHIFKSGKSAIYIGGCLQMYWGILGNRWFKDRPDVIRLFMNKHWSRAKESEKPSNYKNIENSCYW